MATKTKTDPRAKLLSELKSWVIETRELRARKNLISCKIYANTYAWCDYTYSTHGGTRNITDIQKSLAQMVGKSRSVVATWYLLGRFMVDNKIDPEKAQSRVVRILYAEWENLTKAQQLKGIDLARKGDTKAYDQIHKDAKNGENAALTSGIRRYGQAIRDSGNKAKLTAVRVKMEALALQTFMEKHFGVEVVVSVYEKETEKVLVTTD